MRGLKAMALDGLQETFAIQAAGHYSDLIGNRHTSTTGNRFRKNWGVKFMTAQLEGKSGRFGKHPQ